jgi:hypothetical protein
MKFYQLSTQEAALRNCNAVVEVDYTDLNTTADTTLTQNLVDGLAAGTRIEFIGHQLVTAFDGGATSELTVALGYDLATGTDDADGFLAATSVHADATFINGSPRPVADISAETVDQTYGTQESTVIASLRTAANTTNKRGPKVFAAAADIEAAWVATGANLTVLTAGKVRFFFRINAAA